MATAHAAAAKKDFVRMFSPPFPSNVCCSTGGYQREALLRRGLRGLYGPRFRDIAFSACNVLRELTPEKPNEDSN
jgi:hypothetical protein